MTYGNFFVQVEYCFFFFVCKYLYMTCGNFVTQVQTPRNFHLFRDGDGHIG